MSVPNLGAMRAVADRLDRVGLPYAFVGGSVVYTNAMKTLCVGVPQQVIEDKGAVSEEVARLLAEGIRERMHTTLGMSLTGIAGPPMTEGPDKGKPVGLVYVGLATEEGTQVRQLNLAGDRDRIRLWAVQHALELLRMHLL